MDKRSLLETIGFLQKYDYTERNNEVLNCMAGGYDGSHYDIYEKTHHEVQELLKQDRKDLAEEILRGRLEFLCYDAVFAESQAESLCCIWDMSRSLAEIFMKKGDKEKAARVLDRAIDLKKNLGWVVREEQLKEKEEILERKKK